MRLSTRRPVRRAFERDEAAVREWLVQRYPTIKARADERGATICFAGEAGVRSDYRSGTT